MPTTAPAAAEVTFDSIENAHRRIASYISHTPVLSSPRLDADTGARVFIKPESFQQIGSFKIRGALNKVLRAIERNERPAGLLTASSGNHAQAVASVASQLGMPAIVLMPATASRIKMARTKALGAEVVLFDADKEERASLIDARLAANPRFMYVPAHDDPDVIAGQGTASKEFLADLKGKAVDLDFLVVNCSGGGLAAGATVAAQALSPKTRIVVVEPVGFDDFAQSVSAGTAATNAPGATTICDALKAKTPGKLPFKLVSTCRPLCLTVSDAEVEAAVRFAFQELKLVAEPSGAASLAAVCNGDARWREKRVGFILSGGNVDAEQFARVIASCG